MIVLLVVEGIVIAGLVVLVLGLLRSHAEILRALHDLGVNLDPDRDDDSEYEHESLIRTRPGIPRPAGSTSGTATDLVGTTPTGDPLSVAVTGVEHRTLLAFLSSTCLTCRDLWQAFADPAIALPPRTRLVAVTKGLAHESPSALASLVPGHLKTVATDAAWTDFGIEVAPYFVLVDGPSGAVIGEGAAGTWTQVSSLLNQAVADAETTVRGQDRRDRVDAELLAAGITPGDPRLYHQPHVDQPRAEG